jgi:hypothetical protein
MFGLKTISITKLVAALAAVQANFNLVTLQLPGTGTNNATNNTFLDSSTNNFTVTRAGNTTQGSYSPYSTGAGYWSNYFDGSGDSLTVPANLAFDFGTGNYTVEFWFYKQSTANSNMFLMGSNPYFAVNASNTAYEIFLNSGSGTSINTTISLNTWNHFALVKSSNVVTVYHNGVSVGTINNSSTNGFSSQTVQISGPFTAFAGYISNLRVVKGTAVYTANFTPSTTPLTAVSGTSLLTCQSNRFVDNRSNAFAITRVGDTRISTFGSFVPANTYNASTMGGSMYFDGTGDYLTVPSSADLNLGSSNFTIECWFHPTAIPSASGHTLFAKRATTAAFTQVQILFVSNLTPQLYVSTGSSWGISNPAASVPCLLNAWNHVAVTRSGNNFTLFINGQVSATGTLSGSLLSNSDAFSIGAGAANGGSPMTASYISNFRVVKGTAEYTAAFTPPTAPVSAISGTSLLLNGANGAIVDASAKTVVDTIGNTKISTTVSARGSIYLDGSGDYLTAPTSDNFGYGTGDFTIEFWAYMNTIAGDETIISNLTSVSSVNPHLFRNVGMLVYYTNSGERIRSANILAAQTWTHIAICRASGSTRLFVNGVQTGSTYADANNYGSTAPLAVGTYWSGGTPVGVTTFNGYMNDVRFTKGLARYTTTFTPPTRS